MIDKQLQVLIFLNWRGRCKIDNTLSLNVLGISDLEKDKLKSILTAEPLSPISGKEACAIPEKSRWGSGVGRPHQGRSSVSRSLRRQKNGLGHSLFPKEREAADPEMAVLSQSIETLFSGLLSACVQLRWLGSERKDPPHLPSLLLQPERDG